MQKGVKALAAAVSISSILALAGASPALAWHPKGEITKYVQNQTTGSTLADANSASAAITAKPGDVLKYIIEVRNTGAASSNGSNDMAFVKLTDTLPAGVELVSNPAQRTISESLGTIKPGQKVTKEYQVKVTSQKDGDVITNKACFTGDSTVKDNPQSGCDNAVVKVNVPEETKPETPVTPTTPTKETPTTPETTVPQTVETLPETGASIANILIEFAVLSAIGYAAYRFVQSKRAVIAAIARR